MIVVASSNGKVGITEAMRVLLLGGTALDAAESGVKLVADNQQIRRWAQQATDPDKVSGTVNFIAQDRDGNLASAVSTCGWAWRYPGRVGDLPIIARLAG